MGAAMDMRENKIQQIKMLLSGLAEYFEAELTANQYAMYAEDLEDLDIEQLAAAIKQVRRDPQIKFFPRPAAIREAIVGSQRDEALETANRLIEAITRFGYTNAELAKLFVGSLGWRIVEREGGWENLCRSVQSYEELGMRKAQWRELAAATLRRSNTGLDDKAPSLNAPASVRQLLPNHMKDEGENK